MTDDAARRAKTKGLLVRLTVAPLLLVAVLGLLWWHARTGISVGTDVVMALFSAGAAYEAAAMLAKASRRPHLAIVVVSSAALAGLGLLAPNSPEIRERLRSMILVAATLAIFVRHLRTPREGDLDRVLSSFLPIVFVGYLFGLLRELGDGADGARRIAFVVVVSKASDIGGWIVGKSIGRHKLIPSVSPGKTWEGTIGGLLFSAGAALLMRACVGTPDLSVSSAVGTAAFGTVLGAASILAGLCHSALKRRCGVKDSSSLLPEMGGVLDMVDSLLLAGPVAWGFLVRTTLGVPVH